MQQESILEAVNLTKHFGAIKAVDGVSFALHPGECVGLVGDNGAGKSTIIKMLSGYHEPTSGEIRIAGKPVKFGSPNDSRTHKIETVYQNLALVNQIDVPGNFFLGRELYKFNARWLGWLDHKEMAIRASSELDRVGVNVPSMIAPVATMSGGQRQGIAIARSVFWGSNCLILDEPTAALGVKETANVAKQIEQVRDSGVAVLLVAHDIDLVKRICNRIVVLRQGKVWSEIMADEVNTSDIVHHITGTMQ
ncbi:ATP-binding cassette domain-containing protein [Nitratireductor sp. GCM10026969]|uniref:ATP-binding cassette domain-containing protein n=1 Tax=Nitratireductor sp. GCM10026969 TaxID=3252645 RepID=UPI0036064648